MFDNIFDFGYNADLLITMSFKSIFNIFLLGDKKVDRKLSLDFFHKIKRKSGL